MRIFILEDSDERLKEFRRNLVGFDLTICKDPNEAISVLTTQPPFDVLFLDHDLEDQAYLSSDDERTGAHVIRRVIESNPNAFLDSSLIVIHSLNHPGALNMRDLLPGHTQIVPFCNFQWDHIITTFNAMSSFLQ